MLPEPVEVIATIPMGTSVELVARGLRPNQANQGAGVLEMVLFRDWIFDEALYKQEALRFELPTPTRTRAEKALDLLRRAWRLGRFERAGTIEIIESRALQAFNRLVFQEMLGFTDLVFEGPTYSLLPEVSFSRTDGGRTLKGRADLTIGDFSGARAQVVGVTELKSPGKDLTAPQAGKGYKSDLTDRQLSAIDQAVEAMNAAGCDWALVSNLKRMCLVHSSDVEHALTYDLTTLDLDGVRSFFFAFGPGGFNPVDQRGTRLENLRDRSRRLAR